MLRIALVLVGVAVLLGCGVQEISKEDYGEDWPFGMSELVLYCEDDMVWVQTSTSSDVAYPLNGRAERFLEEERPDLVVRDLEGIWRPAPSGGRMDVGQVIKDGLELC